MQRKCAVLLLLLANVTHAGTAFVGFDIGGGNLNIDDAQVSPNFDLTLGTEDNAIVGNLNGGYEFDNGLVIAGQTETMDQINFLGLGDSVEVNVYKVGIGFGTAATERFRVHGTVGVVDWELEARESFFINPGPETTGFIDGEDLYFDVGGEYLFNDAWSLVFLYNYNNYDFGDADAFRLGVRFRFRKNR